LSSQENFKIDGNWVVWVDTTTNSNSSPSSTLKLYNGTSTVTLADQSSSPFSSITVANNKVAWVGTSNNSSNRDIFLSDGTTTTQITMVGSYSNNNSSNLTIVGNSVLSRLNNDLYITQPLPGLSINSVTVIEGQTPPQNAVLTVTLSAVSTTTVTVQYATNSLSSGGAVPVLDYTTTTGTLTFNAGETTKTINVPILDDNFSESNKTYCMTRI
jgi:hypothetical protein